MTCWTQPRRTSRHMIHHSLWYTRKLFPCLCLLHPSSTCSPSEYAPSHHTANIPHPSTWMYLLPIWISTSHSFSSLYSHISLFDRQSGHFLMSQPSPKTLLRNILTTSSNFKISVSQELLITIMRPSQASGKLDNRSSALISSSKLISTNSNWLVSVFRWDA